MAIHRRLIAIALLLLSIAATAAAEEIWTVGVFSSEEVLRTFYQDSDTYRAWIRERDAHEQTVERELRLLEELQADRARATERNQTRTVERLTQEIEDKIQYINDLYALWSVRKQELTEELTSDVFYARLSQAVEYVATNEGFTTVFDVGAVETPIPFWYSPEVDITQKVTAELISRYR